MTPQRMDYANPMWDLFLRILDSPLGVDMKLADPDDPDSWTLNCGGHSDTSAPFERTTLILEHVFNFELSEIDRSISFFNRNGGYCDCEILMNVARYDK
jgi:Protein of unknown function (DUF2695)